MMAGQTCHNDKRRKLWPDVLHKFLTPIVFRSSSSEFSQLTACQSTHRVINTRRMKWEGHVPRMGI
jgi:hypothetical protein